MRILLICGLILSLGLNAFAREAQSDSEKVKNQIHILNLLNGLELGREQMRLILDAARSAEDIRLKTKQAIAQKEKESASAYDRVLSIAKTGTLVIPEGIASAVHKINEEMDQIKKAAQEELSGLTAKIKDNLEPQQIYALDDYKPCIIPPVKQGRIGQADNPMGFTKILERARALPDQRYNFSREKIAQRAIDRMKAKVPAGFIIDEDKLKNQLLKAMDAARAMPEVDFSLKKDEIAQNIKTQLHPERPPMNIGVKIEHFLLCPEIIPLLEQRLASS